MASHQDNVCGLLLLDKPQGMTSNRALQNVKHLFNAKKAGHTGSLDPIATGLLPICFGEATKLSRYLLDADKSYLATFKLGECTNTLDADGEITRTRSVKTSIQKITIQMAELVGVINQVPPMYSALKINGKPLYELARKGIEIKREPRQVVLQEFEFIDYIDNHLQVGISCSSGFYVRSLAHDLGEILGCGAHVSALRRTGVGNLSIRKAISLEQLYAIADIGSRQALLQPADHVLNHMVCVELDSQQVKLLFQGQNVTISTLPSKGLVRLYHQRTKQFLGVGLINQGHSIRPKRLVDQRSLSLA